MVRSRTDRESITAGSWQVTQAIIARLEIGYM